MAMTANDIQARFMKAGKLIYLSQLINDQALEYKRAYITTVDQQSSSNPGIEYDVNDQVISPLAANVNAINAAVATTAAKVKAAMDLFLKRTIAADLGLPTNAGFPQIGTALAAAMTAAGQAVSPSGTNGSNADGFAMYFATNYGIVLPQQGVEATITDGWIDATVRLVP